MRRCASCGNELTPGGRFCEQCGAAAPRRSWLPLAIGVAGAGLVVALVAITLVRVRPPAGGAGGTAEPPPPPEPFATWLPAEEQPGCPIVRVGPDGAAWAAYLESSGVRLVRVLGTTIEVMGDWARGTWPALGVDGQSNAFLYFVAGREKQAEEQYAYKEAFIVVSSGGVVSSLERTEVLADLSSTAAVVVDAGGRGWVVTAETGVGGFQRLRFRCFELAAGAVKVVQDRTLRVEGYEWVSVFRSAVAAPDGFLYVAADAKERGSETVNALLIRWSRENPRPEVISTLRPPPGSSGLGKSRIAAGPDGLIHLVCEEEQGEVEVTAYRAWNGTSWSAPVYLGKHPGQPDVAAGIGAAHVAFSGSGMQGLMYTTGASTTWETVEVVAAAFVGEKMVALGTDGSLHVVATAGTRGGTRILYLRALAGQLLEAGSAISEPLLKQLGH